MTTGENIRKIRKEKGFTQKQLAELCGMYESQIRKYELGTANPKLNTIRKIADALEVYMGDLISDWSNYSAEEIKKDFKCSSNCISAEVRIEERMEELLFLLNDQGQKKAIEQVELLTKIPEYQVKISKSAETFMAFTKDGLSEMALMPNAAHERTDIEVTDEMHQHDNDIMDDDSEWE